MHVESVGGVYGGAEARSEAWYLVASFQGPKGMQDAELSGHVEHYDVHRSSMRRR